MIPILLDIAIFVAVAWLLATQIILPILRGSHVFPAFSSSTHSIADEIAEVEQEIAAEHARQLLELKRLELEQERHTHGLHPE